MRPNRVEILAWACWYDSVPFSSRAMRHFSATGNRTCVKVGLLVAVTALTSVVAREEIFRRYEIYDNQFHLELLRM
jgi:hypothetical protein